MAAKSTSNPPYGRCETFFVESDDGYYTQKAEAREHARAVARQRQRVIAEELSRQTAEEYQGDVLAHMERMEAETLPDVNSINIQTEIQWFMRPYLLDFLIEAHGAFQLLPETLYLAVNLLDRYCSKRIVYKRHYQLVGCAALLIAAKYGDRKDRVPTIRELKSMCCSLYEDEMFTQMEWHVLQTLNWMIGHPTVDSFLQIALADCAYDPEVEHMAWYICEIALFHKEFVSVRPSVLARSSLALARCILGRPQAPQSHWAGYYDAHIVVLLSHQLERPSTVLARKYSSSHLSLVSTKIELFLQQQAQLQRQSAPLTPPVDAGLSESKTDAVGYASPHTPQKAQYPGTVAYGYLTPPITPDSEAACMPRFGKDSAAVHGYPHPPLTPSPSSGVNQTCNPAHFGYASNQWASHPMQQSAPQQQNQPTFV